MNPDEKRLCANRTAAKRNVVSSVNGRSHCGCYAGAMQRPRRNVVWNSLVAATVGLLATIGAGHAASTVVGWGSNEYGQKNVPSGLSNVVAIAAGFYHNLALTGESQVVGWGGGNTLGQTNIPSGLSNVVAIAAGCYHSLALTREGRVVGWGWNSQGQTNVPTGLSNVVAIAAGHYHSLALTGEGRVVGWGYNAQGQTNIPGGLSNVVAIAGGEAHSLALTAEGRVVGWGKNYEGQTNIPSGLSNVVAIVAGFYHSLAVTGEGRVVGWGYNAQGQTNIPSGLGDVVAIAAGYQHSLALTDDGFPRITMQTASRSAIAGGTVVFQAWAAGMPPLHYQWQKDGTNLLAQTNAWLRLDGVTASHAGNYTVIVSNFAGPSATSSVTTLTVSCLLNVAATAGGSAARNPDLPLYAGDSVVTVTATPTIGHGFIRWTGDATGSTNPLTVSMDANKNITAVFASTALTLASQGVGTFTKLPDQPFYAVDQQVTLAAVAGRWHVFSGWTDGNSDNPRIVTIGESNAYTAVFTPTTPLDTATIGGVSRLAPVGMPAVAVDGVFVLTPSASARGLALVAISTTFPGGLLLYTLDGTDPAAAGRLYAGPFKVQKAGVLRTIAYNADFSQSVAGDPLAIVILPTLTGLTDGGGSVAVEPPAGNYFSNALAVVTATPAPGWTFLQWLGDTTSANPVVNLSMTRNKAVRAVFGTTLNTTVVGGGSIVVSPVSPWYAFGSQIRLTAVPIAGNYLVFWANAAIGQTNNPLVFTVTNASPTVTAVFASLGGAQTNALTVIPDGRGHVALTPPGNRFALNTNVVLQATPEAGQEFLGWAGAASGTANPLVVTMNSNKVITANFTKRPWLQGEGNPDLLSQDGFRLTLSGEFGAPYEILASTDLKGWAPLGTVTNNWGAVQFTEPGARTNMHRAYRAKLVE